MPPFFPGFSVRNSIKLKFLCISDHTYSRYLFFKIFGRNSVKLKFLCLCNHTYSRYLFFKIFVRNSIKLEYPDISDHTYSLFRFFQDFPCGILSKLNTQISRNFLIRSPQFVSIFRDEFYQIKIHMYL
jgi:hypothetical protein